MILHDDGALAPDGCCISMPSGRAYPLMQISGRRRATLRASFGVLGCSDDRIHVLIGTGRLLGDTARRRRADQNSLRCEIIDDLAPAPLPERGMAGHRAAGAVACRREGLLLGRRLAHQDVRAGPHAAADQHRLSDRTQRLGKRLVTGSEGAGRAFAMNEQITVLSIDRMPFDLAGIVRDVEQQAQITVGKEVAENAPRVVAEDFAIGERAVDRGPHRAEVALADLRVDRRAGEFAVGELDA